MEKIDSIPINAGTVLPDSRVRYFKIIDKRESPWIYQKKKKKSV